MSSMSLPVTLTMQQTHSCSVSDGADECCDIFPEFAVCLESWLLK